MSATPTSPSAPMPASGWLLQTWRLTRWNLFLARRRLMSKVLLVLLLLGLALLIGGQAIAVALTSTVTFSSDTACPPTSVATSPATPGPGDGSKQPCIGPSPAEQEQEQQAQQAARDELRANLTFPTILGPVAGFLTFLGVILLCILLGTLVGSEYGFGTQRLALARGISRAQVLLAQVLAMALLALLVVVLAFVLSALAGLVIGPALGGNLQSVSLAGLGEIVTVGLATALTLFAYGSIALFLATLARSTAAGIAGSLGYLLVELIVLPIVVAIAGAVGGDTGRNLSHLRDVFLSTNASSMITGVSGSPLDLGGGNTVVDPLQGLLVTLAYCAVCIGVSYWLLRTRDVTN